MYSDVWLFLLRVDLDVYKLCSIATKFKSYTFLVRLVSVERRVQEAVRDSWTLEVEPNDDGGGEVPS